MGARKMRGKWRFWVLLVLLVLVVVFSGIFYFNLVVGSIGAGHIVFEAKDARNTPEDSLKQVEDNRLEIENIFFGDVKERGLGNG